MKFLRITNRQKPAQIQMIIKDLIKVLATDAANELHGQTESCTAFLWLFPDTLDLLLRNTLSHQSIFFPIRMCNFFANSVLPFVEFSRFDGPFTQEERIDLHEKMALQARI